MYMNYLLFYCFIYIEYIYIYMYNIYYIYIYIYAHHQICFSQPHILIIITSGKVDPSLFIFQDDNKGTRTIL